MKITEINVMGHLERLVSIGCSGGTLIRTSSQGRPTCIAIYLISDRVISKYGRVLAEASERMGGDSCEDFDMAAGTTIDELFDWMEHNTPHWGFIPVYLENETRAVITVFCGTEICAFIAEGFTKLGLPTKLEVSAA